jgi:hypothetical protein
MAKQKLEIECPVCDAKISIDARSCPRCGADLGMADFQDLEDLAKDISEGRSYSEKVPDQGPAEETKAETVTEEKVVVIPSKEEPRPEIKESKKESKPKVQPAPPAEPRKQVPKEEVAKKAEPKAEGPKRPEPKLEEARKVGPKAEEPKKEEPRKPEAAEEEEEVSGEKGKKKGLFSKFFGKKK